MTFVMGTDGNDSLTSAQGGDVFQGGLGNDTISAGFYTPNGPTSTATVIYNRGDGTDFLLTSTFPHSGGRTGRYIVQFGEGIRIEDLVLQGYDRYSDFGTLVFAQDAGSIVFGGVVLWRFNDGMELSNAAMLNWLNLGVLSTGPNAMIDLSGKPASETVRTVYLEEGNDTVIGSISADSINGVGGNNSLLGGGGDDTLAGSAGNDTLLGGDGNDQIYGGSGINWLQGGGGDDDIWLSGTQDTVFYGRGDSGSAGDRIFAMGHDFTLKFGQGLNAVDLTLTPGANGSTNGSAVFAITDFTMSFNGGKDRILVNTGLSTRDSAAKVEFADGSTVSMVSLLDKINATPIAGRLITGAAGADALVGTGGNDTLQGLAGKDTLTGGAGDDLLVGGKGSDNYVIGLKDGHDTIVENESSLFATDVLQFTGSSSKQLWFQRTGNDLKVTVIGTHDDVTVQGWFSTSNARVEKIVASDGKTLQASKVQSLVNAMASFTPPADGVNALPANSPAGLLKVVASNWA
jgi:Ca2+-binding RTX toxin-like protein